MLDFLTGMGADPDKTPLGLVQAIDLGVMAASGRGYGPSAIFYGYSVAESTGGATAKVRLRAGAAADGPVLARITLAAGGSDWMFTSDPGILALGGVFVEVVSGSVELSIYLVIPTR